MSTKHGTISRLVTLSGYGFVTAAGVDYFFHATAVVGATFELLAEGQAVAFEEDPISLRGLRCSRVVVE